MAQDDMFYKDPTGSGRMFRVCSEHQPVASDPENCELDLDTINDCDDCSEVDPDTFEDLGEGDDVPES